MAGTLQFDLVSPERSLASLEATEVQIPGADGDMTAMPDHSPVITTLRPGILTVVSASGTQELLVTGGFAEITPQPTSVLAERAMPRDEVTADTLNALKEEAAGAAASASAEDKDAADKLVADIDAVSAAIGV